MHHSPSLLNIGIPILLCQEHGKTLTSFQRVPMGERLLEKKGTGCLVYTDINMLLYIYSSYAEIWESSDSATFFKGGWKKQPLTLQYKAVCSFLASNVRWCTLLFYLKYLAISELLQWSILLSTLNTTACISYRKQRSVSCILTNLCVRRKMHMHVTSFFLLEPYLLSAYIYVCVYIYECINMYVIHILLQGLEKKLRIRAGMRKISKSSLKVKSHELNTISDDTHHCNKIHHVLLCHNIFIIFSTSPCSMCMRQTHTLRKFALY